MILKGSSSKLPPHVLEAILKKDTAALSRMGRVGGKRSGIAKRFAKEKPLSEYEKILSVLNRSLRSHMQHPDSRHMNMRP